MKLVGINMGAMFMRLSSPGIWWINRIWPRLSIDDLPKKIKFIIQNVPITKLDNAGFLQIFGEDGLLLGQAPLHRTMWNLRKIATIDKLSKNQNWGIVLHWFGDKDHHNLSLPGYLAGFNGEQLIDGAATQTSAHYLVGDDPVVSENIHDGNSVGIIQTQAPASDGTPYVSSHLLESPFADQTREDNYFVRAIDELTYFQPGINSILPGLLSKPSLDPNLQTISIEISGFDFDNLERFPSTQKIANVVSLILAIMNRYNISATNVLGHYEFNLGKADPGKNFLALIRLLLGIEALVRNNAELNELVFGQFKSGEDDYENGVLGYFEFVRDYLLLISSPDKVYDWEALTNYWLFRDILDGKQINSLNRSGSYVLPYDGEMDIQFGTYTDPNNHEGVDILVPIHRAENNSGSLQKIQLIGNGECIYLGEAANGHWGKTAMFRHREVNGAELVSIYAHLHEFTDLSVGDVMHIGDHIGSIKNSNGLLPGYLHFSIAYGGTWDTDLKHRPYVPLNAGQTWIRQRFLDPVKFFQRKNDRYVRSYNWTRIEKILTK